MGFINIRGFGGIVMVLISAVLPVFATLAIALPWYFMPPTLNYTRDKKWYLFFIEGFETYSYYDFMNIACYVKVLISKYTLYMCGNSHPLCTWYVAKCNAWGFLMLGCWSCGFCMGVFALMCSFGFLLAIRGTSISIKVLGFFDCFGIFICGVGVVMFSVFTSQSFDMANQQAIYPQPAFSLGWIVATFLCIPMGLIQSCLCLTQYKKARREELGIPANSQWDSDDDLWNGE
jgi:hypothetical protein